MRDVLVGHLNDFFCFFEEYVVRCQIGLGNQLFEHVIQIKFVSDKRQQAHDCIEVAHHDIYALLVLIVTADVKTYQ